MPSKWSHSCCTTRAWKSLTVRSIGWPSSSRPTIAQPSIARHEPTHARNAQAAFPSRFALVAQELDLGVDEHRQRHGLGIGIARVRARARRRRPAAGRRSGSPRGPRRRWRASCRACRARARAGSAYRIPLRAPPSGAAAGDLVAKWAEPPSLTRPAASNSANYREPPARTGQAAVLHKL